MEHAFIQFIQANPNYAYLIVFGVLLLCGLGLPMPEDIILVTGGYLAYLAAKQGMPSPTVTTMLVVGMVGVLVGDSILFLAGKRLGPRVVQVWPFRMLINPKRMKRVQGFFDKYGARTAFFARFAAGVRAPTYLLAGTAGMKYRTFLLADGTAALLSVPAWILLAYHFGAQIDRVKDWMAKSKWAILALFICLGIYIVVHFVRKRLRTRREAAEAAAISTPAATTTDPTKTAE